MSIPTFGFWFVFFLIRKIKLVAIGLVPAEPSLTLAFPGFLAPLHIFCLGLLFQQHFFVLNASFQCHNTLWRRLCCMDHIFEYNNPVKNFKHKKNLYSMVRKISLLSINTGNCFFIIKISIFGSLFYKVCECILQMNMHYFINILRVLRDNRIQVLPISLYTRITDHD